MLKRIAKEFETGHDYNESAVNEILLKIYDDYVTIRRYLIDCRFLEREKGRGRYWLNATVG